MAETTQQLLDRVDTAIQALIANPEVDYTEGDVTRRASQKMSQLLAIKKQLLSMPDAEITRLDFDFNISPFGEDLGQYET